MSLRLAAYVLSLAASASASASDVAPVFTIDAAAAITESLNFPLLDCVGSGHAALAMRADYQAHLRAVQRDIGFKHIRGHGAFNDDMSAFLDGGANMFNLNTMLDFFLSIRSVGSSR